MLQNAWDGRRGLVVAALAVHTCMPQPLATQPAAGTVDPVAHAKDVIGRTAPWWSRLGYSTKVAQYTVGWMAAQPAGYLLLGSSALTFTAVNGGLPGVLTEVARSTVLALAEQALEVPEVTARRVAASQRDASLEAYAEARRIASAFLASGRLTDDDARAFLELRWGVVRLEVAGALYAASLDRRSARDRVAEEAARVAITELADQYLLTATGVPPTMRTAEAVLFLSDVRRVFERRHVGVASLPAFRDYQLRLQEIEQRRLDELATLRPASDPGVASSGPDDGSCPDVSRLPKAGDELDPAWMHAPLCVHWAVEDGVPRRYVLAPAVAMALGTERGRAPLRLTVHGRTAGGGDDADGLVPAVLVVAREEDGRWRVVHTDLFAPPPPESDNFAEVREVFLSVVDGTDVLVVNQRAGSSSDVASDVFVITPDGRTERAPLGPRGYVDLDDLVRLGLPRSSPARVVLHGIPGPRLEFQVAVFRTGDEWPCPTAGLHAFELRLERTTTGHRVRPVRFAGLVPCSRRP